MKLCKNFNKRIALNPIVRLYTDITDFVFLYCGEGKGTDNVRINARERIKPGSANTLSASNPNVTF